MPSSQTSGICKLISFCPSAIESFKQGIFPITCGFQNNEPIVCCANASATSIAAGAAHTTTIATIPPATTQNVILQSTSPTKVTLTVSSATTQKIILQIGDKSKQKCKEYGEYINDASSIITINSNPLPQIDDCAVIQWEGLLLGPPKPKEFPHVALIGFDGDDNAIYWDCSGSLISEKFVLSAAHCTYHKKYLEPRYILLGELVLDSEFDDASPQKIPIKNIIPHPDYQSPSAYNDIALFELEYNVILNTYIRPAPACLNTNPNLTNKLAIESGWELLSSVENVGNPNHMLKHEMDMNTITECNRTYRRTNDVTVSNGIVEEIQLCAGINKRSDGHPCLGNSGGPLQIVSRDIYCMYEIIGIASFGKFCGRVNNPGIYTRVSGYIKWIEDIVWP